MALAVLLLGGSLVLAGQALDGPGPNNNPAQPGLSPALVPLAPALLPLDVTLVATPTVDIEVELPAGLSRRGAHRLRIYVNDHMVREVRLTREPLASVADIPLEQGANRVSAAIAGPNGESLHSAVLEIERDDEPPPIQITSPSVSHAIYSEQVTLRGRTEASARVNVRNTTTEQEQEAEADQAGLFEVRLELALGRNVISLRSRDPAGNRSRTTLRLERIESRAGVSLEIRPETIELDELPATIELQARIRGLEGEPLHEAAVHFSLSVPGQQTLTYQTTSRHGLASWRDIRIPVDGVRDGQGLATVMIVLGDGQGDELTLQESAPISFR
ncbi:hypothetical protein BH24CHL6_BH24CHL6_12320 [soil metagenome]